MEQSVQKTFGNLQFRLIRSPRYRCMTISVKPVEGVVVTCPASLSDQEVYKVLQEKSHWIQRQSVRIADWKNHFTRFEEGREYRTRAHRLVTETHARPTIHIKVEKGIIKVIYPEFAGIGDPKVQAAIRKGVEEAWRIEAKSWLPERTEQLAGKFGFRCGKVTVRDSRTRWGSCSWDNNISLSLHLMMLPDHLIDYVILHELVHTVHKNHGKGFWQMLDTITGGVQKLEKEINSYQIGIY